RAGRDADDQVVAALAVHLLALPRPAALRPPVVLGGEVEQGVLGWVGFEIDAAAIPPVTAVGAALGDVFFPPERNRPRPAVTGLHENFGFIDEHGNVSPLRRRDRREC